MSAASSRIRQRCRMSWCTNSFAWPRRQLRPVNTTQIVDRLLMDGLFITLTNVNFDNQAIAEFTERVRAERREIRRKTIVRSWSCGRATRIQFRCVPPLLFGMKGMAAYAHHAMNLGYTDDEGERVVLQGPVRGQSPAFGRGMAGADRRVQAGEFPVHGAARMRPIRAHFGRRSPQKCRPTSKGPFIVVSGHDLGDLTQLLGADGGKGHQHLHAQRNAARARLSGTEKTSAPCRAISARHGRASRRSSRTFLRRCCSPPTV